MFHRLEAAARGELLPSEPTPLKMLPLREPPPVVRATKKPSDGRIEHDSTIRRLFEDRWANDVPMNVRLGRILHERAIDENLYILGTTVGKIIVDSKQRVVRGKCGKQSIFGHHASLTTGDEIAYMSGKR